MKTYRIIAVELWKAINNLYFWIAMGIGLIIVYLNVRGVYYAMPDATQAILDAMASGIPIAGFKGFSLFLWWISANMSQYSVLFYQLFPIIAAIPYGWSFCQERKNGLMIQYSIRSNRISALFAKYIAVFISGGLVVSVPVLVDLLLNALICPSENLMFFNPITMIFSKTFLSKLFFTHPWVWSLIWCAVDFLWGGSAAVLCFLGGKRLYFSSFAVLIPYVAFYIIAVITNIIQQFTGTGLMLDPFYATMAMSFGPVPSWWIFSVTSSFLLSAWLSSSWQVNHNDFL